MIDAFKPGYRSLRGPLMSAGDTKRFEVVPGTHEKADLVLKPALYFAGVVVDEQGKPIPGVSIRAYANGPRSRRMSRTPRADRMGRSSSSTTPKSRSFFGTTPRVKGSSISSIRTISIAASMISTQSNRSSAGAASCPRGGLQGDGEGGR